MGYTLRQVETERKFCQSLTVEALERAVPLETITSVLLQQGGQVQRERKLNMVVTVWVVIAMNPDLSVLCIQLGFIRLSAYPFMQSIHFQ